LDFLSNKSFAWINSFKCIQNKIKMGIGMGKLIKIEERGRILIPKNLR
jgi:hypothetical protein